MMRTRFLSPAQARHRCCRLTQVAMMPLYWWHGWVSMPLDDPSTLNEEYASAILAQIEGAGEEALARAYEVGRRALHAKLSVADVALLHHQALAQVVSRMTDEDQIAAMGSMLVEALAPFVTRFI